MTIRVHCACVCSTNHLHLSTQGGTHEAMDTPSTTDGNLSIRLPQALSKRLEDELASRHARGLMTSKSDIVREALDRLLPFSTESTQDAQADAVACDEAV